MWLNKAKCDKKNGVESDQLRKESDKKQQHLNITTLWYR